MIQPDEIPRVDADLDVLTQHARALVATGRDFADTGADLNAAWQALAALYHAPEASMLLTAMVPVRTKTDSLGTDLEAIGHALSSYADAVRPLQVRLSTLWAEAWAFRTKVDGQEDWNANPQLVAEHNQLLTDVDAAVAAFNAAERTCANAIDARFGGTQWIADNLDGARAYNEYGFTADRYDAAARSGDSLWGTAVSPDVPWWQDLRDVVYHDYIRNNAKSFLGLTIDGVGGDAAGLSALLNPLHFDQFKQSWTGLTALSLTLMPSGAALTELNRYRNLLFIPKGLMPAAQTEFGKGFLAWDDWKHDPARAAGHVTWNIVTTVVGIDGPLSAFKGAEAADGAVEVTRVANEAGPEAEAGSEAAAGPAPLHPDGNEHFSAGDPPTIGSVEPASADGELPQIVPQDKSSHTIDVDLTPTHPYPHPPALSAPHDEAPYAHSASPESHTPEQGEVADASMPVETRTVGSGHPTTIGDLRPEDFKLSEKDFGPHDPRNRGPLHGHFQRGYLELGQGFEPHERLLATERADQGHSVVQLPRDDAGGNRRIDTLERSGPDDPGRMVEYKEVRNASESALQKNIDRVLEKFELQDTNGRLSGDGIIDGRGAKLPLDLALQKTVNRIGWYLERDSPKLGQLGYLDIITGDGHRITYLQSEKLILLDGRPYLRYLGGRQWGTP